LKTEKITTKPPFPELRGKLSSVRWPALSEIKYDGEYNLVIYTEENGGATIKCTTVNKYGKVRTHFPAVDTIAEECRKAGIQEAVFLAELYTDEGKLGALYDLLSRKEDNGLNISVFDASMIKFQHNAEFEDINVQHPLIERVETIMHVLPSQRTQLKICMCASEAIEHFDEITKQGYEGTVIKSLDSPLIMGPCAWVKQKYKDQTDYEVAIIDPVKERIEVLVPNPNEPDPMMSAINVGVKVMNADKATLKVGDMVTIEHQGILDSGSLRHPVFKGKV
jgi:ATP-dependent DNA ligase